MSRAPEMLKAVSTNVKPKVQVLKQSNVKKKKKKKSEVNKCKEQDISQRRV